MFTFKVRLVAIFMLASLLATLPASHAKAAGAVYRVTSTTAMSTRYCGGSWTTACTLPSALSKAVAGDQIWVKAGTYKPTTNTDRTISFTLKDGVAVYGGFAGNETALDQRDPAANVTILSGNIGAASSIYDNSYHVVVANAVGNTTTLDGFTITGGNADGASPYNNGGGILSLNASPTLQNITVSENYVGGNTGTPAHGYGDGAGIYSTGAPTLRKVVFRGNRTSSYGHGGGMYSRGNALFMDVTFTDNSACIGGGLWSQGTPIVTNVTFSGNDAANGGGMYNNGDVGLTNVTFSGNTAIYTGAALELGSAAINSYPTLTNVTISNNSVSDLTFGEGGAIHSFNSYITIHNSILWGNTAPYGPEVYQEGNQSINIIYSVVAKGCPVGGICARIYTSDPLLGELDNYGGFTLTIPLLSGSVAINRGVDASCPFTDQRGIERPQGEHCDIGAYEFRTPVDPGVYDDSHAAWHYAGAWTFTQGTGTYNDTLHQSNNKESYADLDFNGTQVQLSYLMGPNCGEVEVYVDGIYVNTVNTNSQRFGQGAWTSPLWNQGVHTIRLEPVGWGWINLDTIEVFGDTLRPGNVTGLVAGTGTSSGSVVLWWIAPADDAGNNASGPVASYLVKYSTAPFASWNDGTSITAGLPTPTAPGTTQTMTVSGLNPGTLYYFAIRAQDEQSNLSANYATASAEPDILRPGNVTNFTAVPGTSSGSVNLSWTAPPDDAGDPASGAVKYYELRYSTTYFTGAWDGTFIPKELVPTPAAPGTTQTMTVSGLNPGTLYYFGIAARDEAIHVSMIEAMAHAVATPASDTLPPGDVTGFTASSGSVDGSVSLNWIAPADDAGNNASGPVALYWVKYSTTPFASWNDGTLIPGGVLATAAPGNPQTMNFSNLNPGTLYYFAIRAQDEQSNLSLNYATASATAKPAAVGPGTYDDTHVSWSYTGTWTIFNGTGPYNNTLHQNEIVGGYAEIIFHGNQFVVTYLKAAGRGSFDVVIDGTKVATINANSSTTVWQATWTSPVLSAGVHTVRFVNAGGGWIDMDAIRVIEFTGVGPGTYDDTDPAWVYNGTWTIFNGSGPYSNTLHQNTVTGDYADIVFDGTQISLVYLLAPGRGSINVWIDGMLVETIAANNSTVVWQPTWTSPTLPTGVHTVRFENAGGGWIDIDAVQIQ